MANLTAGDPYVSNFEALQALKHSQDMLSASEVFDDLKVRARTGGRRSRKRKRKATTPSRAIQGKAIAYLEQSPAGSQSESTVLAAVKALKSFEAEINSGKVAAGAGSGAAVTSSSSSSRSASDSSSEEATMPANSFEFTRSELLMVLALRPKSQATLNLIVEECEERLDEAQCERLQEVVESALPVDGGAAAVGK